MGREGRFCTDTTADAHFPLPFLANPGPNFQRLLQVATRFTNWPRNFTETSSVEKTDTQSHGPNCGLATNGPKQESTDDTNQTLSNEC
jgi:hypothetical protein